MPVKIPFFVKHIAILFLFIAALYQPLLSQELEITDVADQKNLFYTVQIGTFSGTSLPEEFSQFEQLNREKLENGSYRYSVGVFTDLKSAREAMLEVRQKSVPSAFVIAYENGLRVSLRDVRERKGKGVSEQQISRNKAYRLAFAEEGTREFDVTKHDETVREVTDLFENQILDYQSKKVESDTHLVSIIYERKFDSINKFLADSLLKKAEIKDYKGDIGLVLNTFYNRNFTPGFVETEDLFYIQRLNVGVDWNILNNGFVTNQLKAKQRENELEISRLQQNKISVEDNYEDLYNYIIYLFNTKKLERIDDRINIIDRQVQIAEMLYSSKERSWEDIIEMKAKKSRAEKQYRKWSNYNTILRDKIMFSTALDQYFNADALPILDPDPALLFQHRADSVQTSSDRILALTKENVDIKHNRLKDYTVTPFIRYSFLAQQETFDRNFSSVGARVRIPLRWGNKSSVKEAEKLMIESTTGGEIQNNDHRLLNYYYEYQYKLEQLIEFYYTHFKIEERLRKEIIKYQFEDPGFSPLSAIQYMDELLANEVEILDIKQQLYLKMLSMTRFLESANPMEYCTTIDQEDFLFKYKEKREAYMWSSFFNSQDNLFLIHYCKVNEIKKVLLSPGPKPETEKVADFLRLAKRYDIEVIGMIGNNSLATDNGKLNVNQDLNKIYSLGFSGIHFDIEPQTFPDWDNNKQKYLSNLIDVFFNAREFANQNGMELSASIPLYYPVGALEKMYEALDYAYLMAYERPDIQFIKRKTAEEFALNSEKTILALRTKDFMNRLFMEKFIEALGEEIPLNKLAIHDLGTLFDLDYNSSMGLK